MHTLFPVVVIVLSLRDVREFVGGDLRRRTVHRESHLLCKKTQSQSYCTRNCLQRNFYGTLEEVSEEINQFELVFVLLQHVS